MDSQSSSKRLKLSSDVDGEAGDGDVGREVADGDDSRKAGDNDGGIQIVSISEEYETEIKELLSTLFPEIWPFIPDPVPIPELFVVSSTPTSICVVKNKCCVAVLAVVDLNNVVGQQIFQFLNEHFDPLKKKKYFDEKSRYGLLINERKLGLVDYIEIHPHLQNLIRNVSGVDRLIIISKMAKYKDPGQETSLVFSNSEEAGLQDKANSTFAYPLSVTQDWTKHLSPLPQSECMQVRQVGVFKMDKLPELLKSLDKYAEDGVSAKKSGSLYDDSDSAESRHHDEPTDYTFEEPIDSDFEEAICGSSSKKANSNRRKIYEALWAKALSDRNAMRNSKEHQNI